ncbi:hypothetical protein NKH18_21160 [Streptomyces sp. M10(2022)]
MTAPAPNHYVFVAHQRTTTPWMRHGPVSASCSAIHSASRRSNLNRCSARSHRSYAACE